MRGKYDFKEVGLSSYFVVSRMMHLNKRIILTR
jgi:hypothetical protein